MQNPSHTRTSARYSNVSTVQNLWHNLIMKTYTLTWSYMSVWIAPPLLSRCTYRTQVTTWDIEASSYGIMRCHESRVIYGATPLWFYLTWDYDEYSMSLRLRRICHNMPQFVFAPLAFTHLLFKPNPAGNRVSHPCLPRELDSEKAATSREVTHFSQLETAVSSSTDVEQGWTISKDQALVLINRFEYTLIYSMLFIYIIDPHDAKSS